MNLLFLCGLGPLVRCARVHMTVFTHIQMNHNQNNHTGVRFNPTKPAKCERILRVLVAFQIDEISSELMKVVSYVGRRQQGKLTMERFWSWAIDYIWQADCFQSPEQFADVVYQYVVVFCFFEAACALHVSEAVLLYERIQAISSFHKSVRDLLIRIRSESNL